MHREGYRFICPVTRVASAEDLLAGAVPLTVTPRRGRFFWLAIAACGTAVVAGTATAVRLLHPAASLHFKDRDWVAISAFENRTGEKLLDGNTEVALESELSQSAYVNIAPTERIADVLKLMRQTLRQRSPKVSRVRWRFVMAASEPFWPDALTSTDQNTR